MPICILVTIAICLVQINAIAINRIDGFPTNAFDASRELKQLLAAAELGDHAMRQSNSTTTSPTSPPAATSLITQLLSALESAIAPSLGSFAPVASILTGWLGNTLTGFFSRELANIGGMVRRDEFASNAEFETFHITIPGQGTSILMAKKSNGAAPSAANGAPVNYQANMFQMAQKFQDSEQEKLHNELSNEQRLLPIAKVIWTIFKLFLA